MRGQHHPYLQVFFFFLALLASIHRASGSVPVFHTYKYTDIASMPHLPDRLGTNRTRRISMFAGLDVLQNSERWRFEKYSAFDSSRVLNRGYLLLCFIFFSK